MNVYMVLGNNGTPSAVFADEGAAIDYAKQMRELHGIVASVLETPLIYGQGSFPGSSIARKIFPKRGP